MLEAVPVRRDGDIGCKIGKGNIVVRRAQVIILKVLALQKNRINLFGTAQVNREYRGERRGFDKGIEFPVDDLACVGHTGEGYGDIIVEGFGFC